VGNRYRSDGACVYEPFNPGVSSRTDEIVRTLEIAFVQFPGISGPQTVIGRNVKDVRYTSESFGKRRCIAQIPFKETDWKVLDESPFARGTYEDTDILRPLDKESGYMQSDKSRRTGY
jgi:hypothetical protein